jgi:uroporphyrinogen decarboxylase
MPAMTPKERILTTLAHHQPDRLPLDFGGRITTIHAYAHRELKQYLGLEGGEEQILDYHTYIVEPDPRLLERFGRDTIPFRPKAGRGWQFQIDPLTHTYVDEWGTTYYMPPDGYYFDIAAVPLPNISTVAELASYRWPDPRDPARMAGVTEAIREVHQRGTSAVLLGAPTLGLWTKPWYLRGMEESYVDLVGNPRLAEALAERLTEWYVAFWDMALARVGDSVDLVHMEGDLGGMAGPLFSPALFRKIFKPRFARVVAAIKARTQARVFLHSCGSVYWAIPDLIECGVDVLNPVQVNAKDMDPIRLKREFGKDLVFWGGGCDPVVLQTGTPRTVRDEAHRRIDALAPGGGFVFGSVHNIQPGVPPENVVALYEAAREYGGYPAS